MANQDEYEFKDLDAFDPASPEEDAPKPPPVDDTPKSPISEVWRNVITIVIFIIISMVIYKFVASFFHKKTKTSTVTPITEMTAPPKVATFAETPVVLPKPVVTMTQSDPDTAQKIATVTLNQESIRTEVSQLTTQVSGVSNNIDALNNKINQLNQTIVSLSDKFAVESHRMQEMLAAKAKARKQRIRVTRIVPHLVYFLQAVIPGRAWLIATNGSTLTVRVGTKVASYGTITRIDAGQGRVLSSSGRVIQFSPEDS